MIEFLKLSEKDPELMSKTVTNEADLDYIEHEDYVPEHNLAKGKSYSLEEINRIMITESSNQAYGVLAMTLKIDNLDAVTDRLGLTDIDQRTII